MIKSLLLNLALSLLVFLPGLALSLVSRWIGMLWLLVGSFALMARSYRREWRLTPWGIVLPPMATGFSFLVQLLLMRLALYPWFLLLAMAAGGVLGLFRGRAHQVFQKEDGVFARRTLGYLLIWLLAYLAAQGFSMARLQGVAAVANVGGAFSLAMLGAVSLVLLFKYWRQRKSPARPLAGLGPSTLIILPATLLLGLAMAGVVKGQETDEEILDRPFNSPQYLISWTGVNTMNGFQEREGYVFYHVPPENGSFAVADGSGGVYINTGELAGGPYNNRREACAAAAGVGQDSLFFIVDNSSFDCSPFAAATSAEASGPDDVAITATTWISSIAMVMAGAAGNVLTGLTAAASAGPTTGQAATRTGPTMVDDTRVVAGREAIEILVQHGAVKVGDCVREDSIQNLPSAISLIAYQANAQGLVCPGDISIGTLWRHPDHDPVETVILPGQDLAGKLGEIGIPARPFTDRDKGDWILVPENTPENVAGIGHVVGTVKDEQGREVHVIDPSKPVIIQHWPSMKPAKPPDHTDSHESDFDDISPIDEAPGFQESDFDGLTPFDGETVISGVKPGDSLGTGALDKTVILPAEPESPPQEEQPATMPAAPKPGIDRELVDRVASKVRDIYDRAGKAGESLGGLLGDLGEQLAKDAGALVQQQIKDLLRKAGLPERFMPDRLDDAAIDELEAILRDAGDARLQQALQKARTLLSPESSKRKVAESLVGKASIDDLAGLLDEIEARLPQSAKAPPESADAEPAPAGPAAAPAPTFVPPQSAIHEIVDAYRDVIPASRLVQLQGTEIQSHGMDEIAQILGGTDELDIHTRAFVRRAPGEAPVIVFNRDVADAGDVLHEMIHVASNPHFDDTLGKQFNEAVTEYFSRPLAQRHGIDRSTIMYNSRGGTAMVQKLVDLVGEDQLKQAYFSDDPAAAQALKEAIDAKLGAGQSDLIRRMTEENPQYPNYDVAAKVLSGEFASGIAPEDLVDG